MGNPIALRLRNVSNRMTWPHIKRGYIVMWGLLPVWVVTYLVIWRMPDLLFLIGSTALMALALASFIAAFVLSQFEHHLQKRTNIRFFTAIMSAVMTAGIVITIVGAVRG